MIRAWRFTVCYEQLHAGTHPNLLANFTRSSLLALALAVIVSLPGIAQTAQDQPAATPRIEPGTVAPAQPPPGTPEKPTNNPPKPEDTRIYGVLANYRTAGYMAKYEPITAKEKFKIATGDSFSWNIFLLAAGFAGIGQLEDSNPSFGEGVKGYAHYYWTAMVDQAVGNYMTEAIFPTMLHEDPRYFRRGEGSAWVRTKWAVGQIFRTRKDDGGYEFNYSEIVGNGVAAAISDAYHPNARDVSDTIENWWVYVGTDTISNVLKEYWPDFKRKVLHHRDTQ